MLSLTGLLKNIYSTKEFVDKVGKKVPATLKMQVECEDILAGGESKFDLNTFSAPEKWCTDDFLYRHLGKKITFPIRLFAEGKIKMNIMGDTLPIVAE